MQYEQTRVLWERLANRKVQALEAVGDKMVADMEALLERQRLLFEVSQGEFLRRVRWAFWGSGILIFGGLLLLMGVYYLIKQKPNLFSQGPPS